MALLAVNRSAPAILIHDGDSEDKKGLNEQVHISKLAVTDASLVNGEPARGLPPSSTSIVDLLFRARYTRRTSLPWQKVI